METTLTTGLTWEDVCHDPALRDLPYKIELDEHGQIRMSPTSLQHGGYQHEISFLIRQALPHGQVVTECAVRTAGGTRVADVAWFSRGRWEPQRDAFEADPAPELCVEILSPGNTEEEMARERRLYFDAGAVEVWICDLGGTLFIFDADGRRKASTLVPDAPTRIDL